MKSTEQLQQDSNYFSSVGLNVVAQFKKNN